MKIVGATEYALVLYRDKLPKFRNNGAMVLNWFEYCRDGNIEKIHPTQKPVKLLKKLIEIFTDPGDVVIDPCAGSGSTLRAACETGRNSYGFEVSRNFYSLAINKMLTNIQVGFCEVEQKNKRDKQVSLFDGGGACAHGKGDGV